MSLIAKDANEADGLFNLLAAAIHMVLNTSVTFCYLSYYFGWSFVLVALTTSGLFWLNHLFAAKHKILS